MARKLDEGRQNNTTYGVRSVAFTNFVEWSDVWQAIFQRDVSRPAGWDLDTATTTSSL